jgi:thioredoxin reductase (NADPH)
MSRYLVERIDATPNIEVRFHTEVSGGRGDGYLETLTLVDRRSGIEEEVKAAWLFVYIGALPHTDWLGSDIARDGKGFVVTGPDLVGQAQDVPSWPLTRPPFPLETSVPGVFAAGDVRLDSMKRVASAVGEGAMVVHLVHRYLATI